MDLKPLLAHEPGVLSPSTPDSVLREKGGGLRERASSLGPELDHFFSSRFQSQPKPHSWISGTDHPFPEWKETFLTALREQLIIPDSLGRPSSPRLEKRIEHADYIEEHLSFEVTPPLRTQAIVTIPRNGKSKHPALVLLHCLGSLTTFGKEKLSENDLDGPAVRAHREEFYEGEGLLAKYARAGYLCIAIDAFGFGPRSIRAEKDPVAFEAMRQRFSYEEAEQDTLTNWPREQSTSARALGFLGYSIAAVTATDDLRTVDYLCSRDDVDRDRIGCTGLSFGSYRTHYLAALDDRIRACASVCWISTHAGVVDYNIFNAIGFFATPGPLFQQYDMVDIAAAVAPKPFLALCGWNDPLMQPYGIRDALLLLGNVWQRAEAPTAFHRLVFDAPHCYNRAMQAEALAFFGTRL